MILILILMMIVKMLVVEITVSVNNCILNSWRMDCSSALRTSSSLTTLCYQNVRCLRSKLKEFYLQILSNDFDVMLTEMWCHKDMADRELFDRRYSVFRCERDQVATASWKRGGEMLVGIHSRRKEELVRHFTNLDLEAVCVKITSIGKPIYFCVAYFPPGSRSQKYELL